MKTAKVELTENELKLILENLQALHLYFWSAYPNTCVVESKMIDALLEIQKKTFEVTLHVEVPEETNFHPEILVDIDQYKGFKVLSQNVKELES